MLRFPNPGSTIANFVAVYTAAFERLNGHIVNLDDIIQTVVAANLATSSGYVGTEAVSRSTRDDRSRDPLFNQLKMYAELFRALGWLHPTKDSSLNYTFTLLGQQVVAAKDNYLPLFRESVLGIVYPSRVLQVLGDFELRPFAFLLKVMLAADTYIARDEMIIGPLNMSDTGRDAVPNVLALIKKARTSKRTTEALLESVAKNRKVQVNTLHNYTRWPIAVLRDVGWAESDQARFADGRKFNVFRLTALGRAAAEWASTANDVRLDKIEKLAANERRALSITAHYEMLGRSNFDLTPIFPVLEEHKTLAKAAQRNLGFAKEGALLYSPFQTLGVAETSELFPSEKPARFNRSEVKDIKALAVGRGSRDHLFVKPILVHSDKKAGDRGTEGLRDTLTALVKKLGTIAKAAAVFVEMHAGDTQTEFYPLVSNLFRILKYESDYSRAGVNYQRWDAYVRVGTQALPIEIKSPTEEVFLSTKAVRQALENKVVLLARGGLETRPELTSLIVGYKIPNERGDMSTLIDDVFQTYGFPIGVIDLFSLATLAARAIIEDVTISEEQLTSLRGYLNV